MSQKTLAEPSVMAQRIYDTAEKLNYPDGYRIYLHLKSNKQYVPYKVIREVYDKEDPVRQLFYRERNIRRPRRKGPTMLEKPNLRRGRFSAADINDRWMADLADLTAQPSGKFQYILVALNVFSKQLWARPLQSKTPAVVTEAFKEILEGERPPSRLDTDSGSEFTGPFQQLLEEKDIWHVVKDPQDVNALAPLDRAIQTLKQSMFRRVVGDKDSDWAGNLQKTVDGYNSTVHNALQGRAPEEVPDDKELQFELRRENAEAAVHNSQVIHARDEKLLGLGGFRVKDPKRTFARSFQPRYGDEVHQVVHAQEGIVLDTKGNVYKSKFTQAVPSSSENVITQGMRGGSVLIQTKNTEALQPFKQSILDFVTPVGRWEFEVAAHMKSIGMESVLKRGLNFRKALLLLGFKVDGRGRVTPPASSQRPVLTPAEAAANLRQRRRLVGKQPLPLP
jgi:hypothetical protein